jgi:hypothetical protein
MDPTHSFILRKINPICLIPEVCTEGLELFANPSLIPEVYTEAPEHTCLGTYFIE